jgi:DNA-binding MarR family transcriptional regulator
MRPAGDARRKSYRNFLLFAAAVRSATSGEAISQELDTNVTDAQADALRFLYLNEHLSMREIATGLGYTTSGATKAINRLEEKGWVVRNPCSEDHREVNVSLTPLGRKIASEVTEITEQRIDNLLSRLPEGTLSRLDGVIEEFLRGVISDHEMTRKLCVACGFEGGFECTQSMIDCVVATIHRELNSSQSQSSS